MCQAECDKLSHSVRQYRNLIDPGNELRQQLLFGHEEARIALEILNMVDRELTKQANHSGFRTRLIRHSLNSRRIRALFVANLLGASLHLPGLVVLSDRARRPGVPQLPLHWHTAYWFLLVFLVIDAAWGVLVLASPRPHRWDFYGLVWGIWVAAVILGSGLASI